MMSMKTNLCHLDSPMMQIVKKMDLDFNKPRKVEKYYVYVRDPSTKNIKKVTFKKILQV